MMYLLLSDNKQSGPYSLDDLKTKSLKAYDLVWVEGRSAAWRYPSEIAELSAFAPAVEEQPFDRFYKKPAPATVKAAETPTVTAEATTLTAEATTLTMTQPVSTASTYHPVTKRTIYVTMPGGIAARETGREPAPVRESAPIREKISYVQAPVTEILPPLPGRRPARIWLPVAIGAAVLVLLAAGIFIGLSIQKDVPGSFKLASRTSGDKEQQPIRTTAQQLPAPPATNPGGGASIPVSGASIPVSGATTPVSGATTASNAGGNGQLTPVPMTANPAGTDRPVTKPRATGSKQKAEGSKMQPAIVSAAVVDSPATPSTVLHREAVHRTDAVQSQPVDDHESLKTALANQISVGTNKYEVGTFGGIHNLQVTVTNRSAYSLDLVVVAVSYIQANKKTYKTENLYFRGIGPGSALMLEAPKSSRGINVQYKVTSINSKELGASEPGT